MKEIQTILQEEILQIISLYETSRNDFTIKKHC